MSSGREEEKMQEQEIWKNIPGFEELYQVNQWGDIYSLYTNKKLKYSISNKGYKQYNLHKNKKAYIMTAHKAVALAFIPNPDNLPLVNHKDENKLNCYVENLEWCTAKYNNDYSHVAKNTYKQVFCYDLEGNLLAIYSNATKAAKDNNISRSYLWNGANWEYGSKQGRRVITIKNKVYSFEPRTKQEILDRLEKYLKS